MSKLLDQLPPVRTTRWAWPATLMVLCLGIGSALAVGAANIRLNQIGFYQYGPKQAVIVSSQAWRFALKSPDLSVTYYTGDVQPAALWPSAGEVGAIADFSTFTRIGTYVIDVAGVGTSYPFRIDSVVHRDLMRGLIRGFYYQRTSSSLPAQYAGRWARNEGHPDTKVIVHALAASDTGLAGGRKAGDVISSPQGWYDAGDYGKYVVNAGITVYTLLSLYERFPGFFDSVSLNIPRQYAGLPDVLSEVKWELDWLLTMQDPSDGGVYHKLTSLDFCGFIMPDADLDSRYVIGKGSAATFDFAAVCAVANRVYKKFLPSFADSCLAAARYAWAWGSAHPNVAFRNPPDVSTGEYGDGNLQDERQWAAIELLLATGDTLFRPQAFKAALGAGVPSWPTVSTLGTYSLSFVPNDSMATAKALIAAQADVLGTFIDGSPFHTVLYNQFYWGSNSLAANEGITFIEAFLATKNPKYFQYAVHTLDYLVGRNALGCSFVTDYGSLSPRHPHHRPSAADGIDDPVPGLLVGGPNVQQNDASSCGMVYPSPYAAKSWVDSQCAYACNEIAINWNAPAAFLAGAIEALYADTSTHVQTYRQDTLLPAVTSVTIASLSPDRATLTWETDQDVSASVIFGPDSSALTGGPVFSPAPRLHSVTLTGLSPSTPYYYRVIIADAFGDISASAEKFFVTAPSSLLDGFNFSPAGPSAVTGADALLSFTGKPGLSAKLTFTAGGSQLSGTVACVENNGTYVAVIPAALISSAGVLYSFSLRDSVDSITTPVYSLAPSAPVLCFATIAFPKAYALFSLPLLFSEMEPMHFFTTELGDNSQWRYYSYSPDSGKYNGTDSLKPGKGAWLYCAQGKTLSVRGMAVKPDSFFAVPLSQGWNVIGSPFTFPVYWENSLIRYNGTTLRIFDKASGQIVRRQVFGYSDTSSDQLNNGRYVSNAETIFSIDSTRLAPWKSYWVYAEKSGAELLINPSASPAPAPLAKKATAESADWRVHFSAFSGGAVDNGVIIGASAAAIDDYDDMDSPKPPLISNEICVGLTRPDWKKHGSLFASDIRGASGASQEWHVAIETRCSAASVKLTWQQSAAAGGFLYLYDSAANVSMNMDTAGAYSMTLAPGETRRDLIVRFLTHADKTVRAAPAAWSLRSGAPNPFKISTAITYSVPASHTGVSAARPVLLAIYDMLGRRVKTLVSGNALPGKYTVVWNGADESGRRLRQGVYVIHFSAEGFSASVKTNITD